MRKVSERRDLGQRGKRRGEREYYRMFSIPSKCTLYLSYTSREVFIWRVNYFL